MMMLKQLEKSQMYHKVQIICYNYGDWREKNERKREKDIKRYS